MQGMKIDFITNTITITKAFRESANEYGTEEYITLQRVMAENPNMKVVSRSVRSSYKRRNESKGLTYKYMRKFISIMDSSNLITFEKTIEHYEDFCSENVEVYLNVKEWFLENYPHHREMVVDAAPQRGRKDAAQNENFVQQVSVNDTREGDYSGKKPEQKYRYRYI